MTGYYASHVTVNGKKSVYYKFKTGSGHTGWVWRGWLKQVSATKSGSKTTATTAGNTSGNWGKSDYERLAKQKFSFNLSAYQQGFLDTVNQERTSRGLRKMVEDPTLTNIAATRAKHVMTTSSHFVPNADGSITDTSYKNLDYVKLAKEAGINYAKSETIGNVNASAISHGLNSDDSIDKSTKLNTVVDSAYNAGKAMVLAYIYDDEDSNNGHRNTILNASYNAIGIGAVYSNNVVINASVYGAK